MNALFSQDVIEALKQLRRDICQAAEALMLPAGKDFEQWKRMMDGKLIPMLSPDFPLIAAVAGGGSSGKSSLFNMLSGKRVSPSGGKAGINRRVLVSARETYFSKKDLISFLFEPFGGAPQELTDLEELTIPGRPLFVGNNRIPSNLILMDTPDFDTGAKGRYTNRQASEAALETADILIYIFTNSNYNNRDNTDFISRMLTRIGTRKCFLVYRVYPSFSDEEVIDHAMTVGRHIYGETAEGNILGIYRADEDNQVAAGETFMKLHPVKGGRVSLPEALEAVDALAMKKDLLLSILGDALAEARLFLNDIQRSGLRLKLYCDALAVCESQCVRQALAHFPMDHVMRHFARVWMATDPAHVRVMRQTGKYVGLPLKGLIFLGKWIAQSMSEEKAPDSLAEFDALIREDLLTSVNRLHARAVDREINLALSLSDPATEKIRSTLNEILASHHKDRDGRSEPDRDSDRPVEPAIKSGESPDETVFVIPAPPAVSKVQDSLKQRDWRAFIQSVQSRQDAMTSVSSGVEAELKSLADEFRRNMGVWEKTRQTFSAFLNILPATAAVTWILSTGDVAGAAGIKVKLTGLFGLQDLYALVAIPATTGLSKADRKQLETLLGPIAKAWLADKMVTVEMMFREEITGDLIQTAEALLQRTERKVNEIRKTIERCETSRRDYGSDR